MQPLYKVFMPEGLDKPVTKLLYSGKLSFGEHAKQFENQLRQYINNPYTLITSNNNYASIIAFTLLDLKEGDEVIASPMACLASNQPLVATGAKVVWADIDPATGSLDPESVKKQITKRTKAILHYHWCGYPGYIDEINRVAADHGLYVIDDAIESFGAEYKGQKIGNCGTDITLFSFQAVRLPNTIDGGAISFTSKELFEKAKRMRDWGIDRSTFRDELGEISPQSDIAMKGFNAMMSDLNGLVGVYQMNALDQLLSVQRANAAIWDENLERFNLSTIKKRPEINPNYWVYSVFSKNILGDLNRFRDAGFYASKVHIRNDNYSCFGKQSISLPGVDTFAAKQISLPSGWWLNLSSNQLAAI